MMTDSEFKRTIIVETFLAFNHAAGIRDDDPRVVEAVQYVNTCSDDEIDRFISGCVDLLASDPTWISTHCV